MSVAAIILAAGASTRLGRPKQIVEIGGETLLARAIRTAREAALHPVLVVVSDAVFAELARSLEATPVFNLHSYEGVASSIRAGVEHALTESVAGAVLMTCDQVAVTAAHLRALAADPSAAAASSYAGTIGIPAYFPCSSFDLLVQLQGDRGARDLLTDARKISADCLSLDIDTEDDLRYARDLLERKQTNS